MEAITILIIILFILCILWASRLKVIIKVLCTLDIFMILGLIFFALISSVHFGYGREFFRSDCSSLLANMKENEDAVILAAIKKHLNTGSQFKYCIEPTRTEAKEVKNGQSNQPIAE